MRTTVLLAPLFLSVGPLAAQPVMTPSLGTTVVDFESGAAGWGAAGSFVDPTAGKGGGAGLRTINNTFGITISTKGNAAFLGDYTPFKDVTISVDTVVNQISFLGAPVSRPWLLELRDVDTKQGGYPWTSVWFLFDNISAAANPSYKTYSVTIADPSSTVLPAGWKGYGDEDPVTFEPRLPKGVTFADVLSGVDEIAFTTLQPGFFFGFTDFDVVVDDITITTTVASVRSQQVVRLGTPANPNAFLPGVTSGPVIGQTWDPVLDHTTFVPNATLDAAILAAAPVNVPVGALGTVLCDLTGSVAVPATPGQSFAFPIPGHPMFLGVQLCVQGVSASPTEVRLANALDITIGSL